MSEQLFYERLFEIITPLIDEADDVKTLNNILNNKDLSLNKEKLEDVSRAKMMIAHFFRAQDKKSQVKRWVQSAADDNFAPAYCDLANIIYEEYEDKNKGFVEADNILKKARDMEFPFAFFASWILNVKHKGDAPDKDAIMLLKNGMDLGCRYSARELGVFMGNIYDKTNSEDALRAAISAYAEAAVLGCHESAFRIGSVYEKGEPLAEIKPDISRAAEHYRFAMGGDQNQEYTFKSMHNLAALAFNNDDDLGISLNDAISLYEDAGKLGSSLSILSMGRNYLEGNSVNGESINVDIPKAIEYFTQAKQFNETKKEAEQYLALIREKYN